MDLGQLRYFTKIVEHRSFTKAAVDCSVSQPALSQQISKLEKELGQPLFERQGRSIRLTSAGQWLHLKALQIIQLADDTKRQITDDGENGRIFISAIPTVAPYLLPAVLKHAAEMLPKAEFEVSEDSTEDLLKRCGNGDVDVGIMALPTTAKGLTIEPLFNEEMLVALSADNPLCESSELAMSDLVDQPFFRLRDVSGLGQSIDAWGGGDDSGRLLLGRIEQLTMIQLLVAQDQGVSCVPEMASAIDLDRRIVYRRLDPQRPSRTVAICFNPQRYQSQLATKFIATVKAFCSADSFSPRNLISPAG